MGAGQSQFFLNLDQILGGGHFHLMKRFLKSFISVIFSTLAWTATSAFAETGHGLVIPSVADKMSSDQFDKIQPEISKIKKLEEKIFILFGRLWFSEPWSHYQDLGGRTLNTYLDFYENRNIRAYSIQLGWRHGGIIKSYYYDPKGRLRIADFWELLDRNLSGPSRCQKVFFDKNSKILEVEYKGKYWDEKGKITEGVIILKKFLPLSDGEELDFVMDPWKDIEEGHLKDLKELISKPERPFQSPYLALTLGEPGIIHLGGGFGLVGPLELKTEGFYWNPRDYDIQCAISFGFPPYKGSDYDHNRAAFLWIAGFGDGASSVSSDRCYSGFGLETQEGGKSLELEFVQDGFFNSASNVWRIFFRIGLLHFLD